MHILQCVRYRKYEVAPRTIADRESYINAINFVRDNKTEAHPRTIFIVHYSVNAVINAKSNH